MPVPPVNEVACAAAAAALAAAAAAAAAAEPSVCTHGLLSASGLWRLIQMKNTPAPVPMQLSPLASTVKAYASRGTSVLPSRVPAGGTAGASTRARPPRPRQVRSPSCAARARRCSAAVAR